MVSHWPWPCVAWPGVAALQDTLYCVGGYDARERALTTVERLPPGATSWEPVAGLNKARGGCGLVALSGKLYAIGGYDGKKAMKSVEMFDPAVGRWVKVSLHCMKPHFQSLFRG